MLELVLHKDGPKFQGGGWGLKQYVEIYVGSKVERPSSSWPDDVASNKENTVWISALQSSDWLNSVDNASFVFVIGWIYAAMMVMARRSLG